ncbi:hypothetical protein NAS2_0640 [Conexivisphaera calida]|uniref:Uncharacterized protein n=1 Tax=Conexivisphaera calida TaxID=1874277 RepID=A0A4P2VBW5_9ARCH|nr:hypothetical protein NAS2_0640 [Conexivisphaera calida]
MSCQPFVLYYGSDFFNKLRKVYGIGMLDRPLPKIFKRYGERANFLDRDQAADLLSSVKGQGSITVTNAQIMKNLFEALFLPTALIYSYFKKLSFSEAAEVDDFFVMEFMGSQSRPMKLTPLIVYMWFVVPKSEKGCEASENLMRRIREDTGSVPMSPEEWQDLRPLIEKFSRALPVNGSGENLWEKI